MTIAESILPEFELEMAGTRKVLERLPEDKLDWKAHEKSLTIGSVASHLANIPSWVSSTLLHDSLDVNPVGGEPLKSPILDSPKQILDQFDANVATAKKLIAEAPDEEFAKNWSLLSEGHTLFTMPKLDVLRTWVVNHTIHHRAHLCVYYRLNGVPVPALYGPSADEQE